jgi:hypothetical protein
VYFTVDWRKHLAHRLAWLYVHGVWPTHQIDHINGDHSDNRIANLRDVPPRLNKENLRKAQRNNRVGVLGVRALIGGAPRWTAGICVDGERRYLGTFYSLDEAQAAYLKAKRALHEGCTL